MMNMIDRLAICKIMKKMKNSVGPRIIQRYILLSLLFPISIVTAQNNSEVFTFRDSSKRLNISKFYDNLETTLKDSTVGYGILITQNNKPIYNNTGGFRITPVDDKSEIGVPFDLSTRMHVASVTKTVTAVALIKILNEKGVSIKERFKEYLPSFWKIHPTFEKMPIQNLLYMKSGIKAENDAFTSSYDSLKVIIEKGIIEAGRTVSNTVPERV